MKIEEQSEVVKKKIIDEVIWRDDLQVDSIPGKGKY